MKISFTARPFCPRLFWSTFLLITGTVLCVPTHAARSPRPPVLVGVNIQGNQTLSRPDVEKAFDVKVGRRVREKKVQEGFDRVQNTFHQRGFLEFQMSTQTVVTDQGLTAFIDIKEGPQYHLKSISVEGDEEVSAESIKREIEMQPGDPFNPTQLMEGRQRLYASGCFELVDLILSTAPPRMMDVRVKVRERHQKFLKGGIGYGNETKERLSVGWEDQSFFGGARRADIKYTYSGFLTEPEKYETRSLEATMITPFIFKTRLENQLTLKRDTNFREAYDSIETSVHASLERRFKSSFSLRLNYRLQKNDLSRVSPEAETPPLTSINAVGTSVRYDDTNDPFLPWNGWRMLGSLEEGLELLKHDVGFHKAEARLGRFDTVETGWTFFEGFQGGVLLPRSGHSNDTIPINERFFLGGANSVRGYSERSLGPKDSSGAPLGGTLYLVTNLEARHKIYKKLFGLVFIDVGNLFNYDPGNSASQVEFNSLNDLAQSAGLGIRYHSIAGAIRLEGGYQLNPENPSAGFKDRTAIHFSIGEVF